MTNYYIDINNYNSEQRCVKIKNRARNLKIIN